MQRPVYMPSPTYPERFDKIIAELLLLNVKYSKEVEEASLRLKVNEEYHDRKSDKLGNYSHQMTTSLQREYDELKSEYLKIRTIEGELTSQITYLVGQVYGMYDEIIGDLKYEDGVTELQFKHYLKGYKSILDSSNNLECYRKGPFVGIVSAIDKYFTEPKN